MASPLTGLIAAIKQRTSAGFHLGICLMNLLSSAMWTIYSVVCVLPHTLARNAHVSTAQLSGHVSCTSAQHPLMPPSSVHRPPGTCS